MDKTKIKNFAVWAREKLITDIKYKAGLLGITDKGIAYELPQSTANLRFYDIGTKEYTEVSGNEIKQREALVKAIKFKEKDCGEYEEAFYFIIEEVAYTWFNRLVAIRFMEVNNYLPSGIRILSSENKAKLEPDFVTSPFDTDLDFSSLEQDKIIQLKDENKLDELFRMLFIKQCNKLHDILPELFERTDDYTELLLTLSFTDKDGIVYHITHDINEEDFDVKKEGQVEIVGWLYQFYNSVPKEIVYTNLKDGKKFRKEDIPAATQLFTPDWIVRYMVENSVGQLWLEGHRDNNLRNQWNYYLNESEQEEKIEEELKKYYQDFSNTDIEKIKIIDPCCGSGHILVYVFDLLMQIYESNGYVIRDAVQSILRNNIYGLDVDKRASQIAYFAIMMKARQYDRRIFSRSITPNIYAICESNEIDDFTIKIFSNGKNDLENSIREICKETYNAKEYGSLLKTTEQDWTEIYQRLSEINDEINIFSHNVVDNLLPVIKTAEILSKKYDVVITNPPYVGNKSMDDRLSMYLKDYYFDTKMDLFAAFIERCLDMCKYKCSLVTPESWMFLVVFKNLRIKLLNCHTLNSLIHLGKKAFDCGFGTCAYVFSKHKILDYKTKFVDLTKCISTEEKNESFLNKNCDIFAVKIKSFQNLPNNVFAYWCPSKYFDIYNLPDNVGSIFALKSGIKNGKNDWFLRYWYEVNETKIAQSDVSYEDVKNSKYKWFYCNSGGGFYKWYGKNEYVLNLYNDAKEIKEKISSSTYRLRNADDYFQNIISWSLTGGDIFSCKFIDNRTLLDVASNGVWFNASNKKYLEIMMGYMNSVVFTSIINMLNPTTSFPIDTISNVPIKKGMFECEEIVRIVNNCIRIARDNWNEQELSWDFMKNPLVKWSKTLDETYKIFIKSDCFYRKKLFQTSTPIEIAYLLVKGEYEKRFLELKKSEEYLNNLFINIYGLESELKSEIDDKTITIARIFDFKEDIPENMNGNKYVLTKNDIIKDFISYAVGCMLGRYSLDADGLVYAGGEWDENKYTSFIPDVDNCIPITDEEYFEDDIVGRFVEFIEAVYGKETLEENLNFIANALGNKGNTPRDVIRNYFLNDFIKDHIKKYKKRPIYWMFDSGKQDGFKALVYMHRWNSDTVGNLRVEYLHKIQRVYEKEIKRMQEIIDNSKNNKEISTANKRKEKLQKQLKETKDYDAKVAHIALSQIDIDLDDGVKVNYEKVQTAQDGKKMQILVKM